ncbi:MAG: aminoacyl-tRNA deacylase [Desulfococcaceae bacterium]
MKSTRATEYLKSRNIPFELISYRHEEKGAVFAAKAIGFPLEMTIKTLVADLGNSSYVLALMPGDRELSLKHLAEACCVKRAQMTDVQTAERITGYLVGGISPFGTRRNLPALMENSLLRHETVVINAGQRGLMLKMPPQNIVKALGCSFFDNE